MVTSYKEIRQMIQTEKRDNQGSQDIRRGGNNWIQYLVDTVGEGGNISPQKIAQHFFLNWDSLHARLNSHYKAWSYKKKKHKKKD